MLLRHTHTLWIEEVVEGRKKDVGILLKGYE
jgi:hypothetical protein